MFDLEKLLSLPGVRFSEKSQAGTGAALYDSCEEFEKLDFDKIYSNGYKDNLQELLPYRHAEILHPDMLNIDSCIKYVLCRNDVEKVSLLNLLKLKSQKSFIRYKNIIKVCKSDMFYQNGLYIDDCRYNDNRIVLSFADTWEKNKYISRYSKNIDELDPISMRIELDWFNSRGTLYHSAIKTDLDYAHSSTLNINRLPSVPSATAIRIRVYIENCIMCCIVQPLENGEVIK